MKKIKKFIIILLVILMIGGGVAGGAFAYQKYQKNNMQAEVVYVSSLNWGFSSDEMTSAGYVTSDYSQYVYTEGKSVAEVKVEEGAKIKVGDPLLVYDTTEEQLQVEMAELELQGIEKDIEEVEKEIEELNKIKPRPTEPQTNTSAQQNSTESTDSASPAEKKEPTIITMQVQKKDGDAYNYINKKAKPYEGKGTPEKPYRFLCTQECYVLGSYLNQLIEKEQVAVFEIWTGNSNTEGTLLSMWMVDGTEFQKVAEDSKWLVATEEEYEDEVIIEEEIEQPEQQIQQPETQLPDDEDYDSDYTEAELKNEISEKQNELNELEIEKRSKELEVERLQKNMEDATVVANIDGVVKAVGDPESPPADGMAFIEIVGSNGYFVKGEISELMLDQIEVGQQITADSWENGQSYTATIKEISEYPSDGSGGYYGEGNPNVSYYSFTAFIEDATGLNNGDYVDLSIMPVSSEEEMNSIYIEKAYVREENGQAYVLKADDEDRLVKQYVQTGKTLYGSAIEIKAGITEEDRLAFPYGKTAKEGIKVIDSEEYY